MLKRKPCVPWAGVLAAVILAGVLCTGVLAAGPNSAPRTAVTDRIVINRMARYGDLELPPVSFFHARHTKALAESGKDCATCHQEREGKMLPLFMRPDNKAAAGLKDLYHSNCIGCHTKRAAAGLSAGPREGQCRDCHRVDPGITDARQDVSFDNVLHYRHWASKQIAVSGEKDNCAACHHVYDAAARKTVYQKGKEGSCRFCHQAKPVQDPTLKVEVRDLRDASHEDCVSCHLARKAAGDKDYGPLDCAGCHSAIGQATVREHDAKVLKALGGKLPSLPMKRPEAELLLPPQRKQAAPAAGATAGAPVGAMQPVVFNHTAHEQNVASCRTCHHKGVEACSECHTATGDKKGGFVTLDVAMHDPKSEHSCVGCHASRQAQPNCAGCHRGQNRAARTPQESCAVCHTTLPAGTDLNRVAAMDDAQRQGLAAAMLAAPKAEPPVYTDEEIPETVTIGFLSKDYQPAVFPHRKIVRQLLKNLSEDKLAGTFHARKGLVCQGCHHNSPVSMTPPACASCHARPSAPGAPDRPGLKAAYHGECMSCHKAMGLTELAKGERKLPATSCVVCHDEKKQ